MYNESAKIAVCVLFYVDNFNHVSPLLQCRWFFSKLNKTVICGAASTPALAPPDCKWLVSSIVDPYNNSVNIRDSKSRKRKYVKFLMHPSTSVVFTYSSYRVVICLDISRSIYSVRSDGGMAADDMITSLFTMLTQMQRSLQSQQHIASVFVTVIAHHSEINLSYSLWQCEMKMNSELNNLLDSLAKCSRTIEDLTFQRVVNPDLYVDGPHATASSSAEGMSMTTVVEDLLYHLALLPPSACPIAVLITPGNQKAGVLQPYVSQCVSLSDESPLTSLICTLLLGIVDVAVSSVTKALAVGNVALHVLVVTLSADQCPLGCVPEIDSLRVVAEATGGSLEVVSSSTATNLESIGQIFIRPFYARREEKFPLGDGIVSRMKESRLQGYQLEGATLEHILAARLMEGFKMTNVSIESFSMNKTSSASSMSFATIRLEKRYSKVSTLVYFVSYRVDVPEALVTRESKEKKPMGDISSRTIKHVYTKGSLSIDIIWISPDRVDVSSGKGVMAESRIMSENDKSMTSLLGLPGMPGYIPSSTASLPVATGKSNKVNVTGSYKYAAVQQQLAANADLIEDICKLQYSFTSTMYLRAFFVLTAIANNAKCRNSIFTAIRQTIPTARFSQLGTLKWLCLIPVNIRGADSVSHTAPPSSPTTIEYYEVLIIEVRQRVSVFIEVAITVMGNGSGENCINVIIVADAVQRALKLIDFDPLLLRRDLSLIAISNSLNLRSRNLSLCHLQSLCHFVPIKLSQRYLMESLVSEVCRNKVALGFQVSNCAGEELVELSLCAVIPACPSGIESDSLLQCKVECSEEGVLTTYYWEPAQEVRQFNMPRARVDPFAMTKEVLVPLGEDLGGTASVGCAPQLSAKNCADMLVDLVHMLVEQDKRTYEFYAALTRIYPDMYKAGSQKSTGFLQAISPLKISRHRWNCLKSHSYKRKVMMPSFSPVLYSRQFQVGPIKGQSVRSGQDEDSSDEDSRDGRGEFTGAVVGRLKGLLRESLVGNMHLMGFDVQPAVDDGDVTGNIKLLDEDRRNTYCQAIPEGLIIVEIDPEEDATNVLTPVRKMSNFRAEDLQCMPEPNLLHSDSQQLENESKSDEDDSILSPDVTRCLSYDDKSEHVMSLGGGISVERVASSQDDLSAASVQTQAEEDMKMLRMPRDESFVSTDEDPSSAKLRVDFHFIAIPRNSLFGNADLTDMSRKCIVATDASLQKNKHDAGPGSDIAESAKNRVRIMKQTMLGYHRYNFSVVLYSGLQSGEIVNVDPMDMETALSHCSSDFIEVDMTNLCTIKRIVYEGSISPSSSVPHLSSPDLFQFTLGKYLTPVPDTDVFLFAPSSEIFNLPKHDSLYSIAVFVRLSIIRKPVSSDTGSDQAPEVISVPNTSHGLSTMQFDLYSVKDDNGESCYETITFRVECLMSSTEDVDVEKRNIGASSSGEDEVHDTATINRERSISDLQSALGGPGVCIIGSALYNFYRTSVNRRLTAELESLLTFDTLHTLLLMPVVTTETIVLVQHCLRGTSKSLCEISHQMDFVLPASSFSGSFVDVLTGYFDEELQSGGVINKIGEMSIPCLYAVANASVP